MNLPLLILFAVALPLTLVVALFLFNRSITWVEARPHLRRRMIGALGLLYGGLGSAGGLTDGWHWFDMLQIVAGVAIIISAVLEKPRPQDA